MESKIACIGFGEAASAFVSGWATRPAVIAAYDRKTDSPATRDTKRADFARAGIEGADTAADALRDAAAILSLVTADQALPAAEADAPLLTSGALWFDMNSIAPDTKRAAAQAIHAAGGRYVDVAVMSPVYPQQARVPLLVSGPHAEAGAAMLGAIGFTNVRIVPGDVGTASSIKMIRSVLVKGLEALTTECVLAAEAAGVRDAVIASLNASWPGTDWAEKADYNLERMMVHGLRRAAEMEEVVKTLDALGTGSAMTRGTVLRQRDIGRRALAPGDTLSDKLDAILAPAPAQEDAA
jgi:3-hydroxyisobutyrate dehydrogenase-like beta-hydroxyacid dehydrogenase